MFFYVILHFPLNIFHFALLLYSLCVSIPPPYCLLPTPYPLRSTPYALLPTPYSPFRVLSFFRGLLPFNLFFVSFVVQSFSGIFRG